MPRTSVLPRTPRDSDDYVSAPITVAADAAGPGFFEVDFDAADAVDPLTEVTLELQRLVGTVWTHKASVRMNGGVFLDRGGVQQTIRGFQLTPASIRTLRGQDIRLVLRVRRRQTSVGAQYEIL